MKKILILDDEVELLSMWGWHFKIWGEKVEIVTGTNGAEGIELLRIHGKFDIIITDFKMPEVNGLEFINHVRASDSKTPIFLFSGYIPEVAFFADRLENVLFFEKPLIGGKFRACLQMYLSGQPMVLEGI